MKLILHLSLEPSSEIVQKTEYRKRETIKKRISSIPYKQSTQLPTPSNMEFLKHTVKKGEKLENIAKQYDLTISELSDFLQEELGTDVIYDGQEIKIPNKLKRI